MQSLALCFLDSTRSRSCCLVGDKHVCWACELMGVVSGSTAIWNCTNHAHSSVLVTSIST